MKFPSRTSEKMNKINVKTWKKILKPRRQTVNTLMNSLILPIFIHKEQFDYKLLDADVSNLEFNYANTWLHRNSGSEF